MTMYLSEPEMFTSRTETKDEYGLSFREQLVLEITHRAVGFDDNWVRSLELRDQLAVSIVSLANMIYENTQGYDEEPEADD